MAMGSGSHPAKPASWGSPAAIGRVGRREQVDRGGKIRVTISLSAAGRGEPLKVQPAGGICFASRASPLSFQTSWRRIDPPAISKRSTKRMPEKAVPSGHSP